MSWQRSVFAAAAVLVAAGAVVLAGFDSPEPVAATARPHEQPIALARLSCPGSPGPSSTATSVLAVGPDVTARVPGPAELSVVGTGAGGPTLGSSPGTGRPVRVTVPAAAGDAGVEVVGVGSQAPGLTAAQLSTYQARRADGTAATWCASPRDEWWFTGVDTSVGTSTLLVLSNQSPAVAVVDLRILGADGVVDAAGAGGIPVGPRSQQVLDLARYAPGQAALTLQVTATRGTVVAAVSTTRLDGLTPRGADWVPASAAPAKSVLVNPAVDVGGHSLVVTNTSTRQQLVSVRILDESGAFTSSLLPDLQVPPQSVVVEDVRAIVKRQTAAIELDAAGPVTGALVSEQVEGPLDFAVSGTSLPLTTPVVVPLGPASAMTLSFATSTPGVQQVEVVGMSSQGTPAGRATVTVGGLAATTWTPPDWGAAYLVVTVPPGSDLHGVASYRAVGGISQLPLVSAPRTLVRPAVLPF